MLVILFRSKLVDDPQGYKEMADEMLALGKSMPGFIDFKSFTAADGERLSVAWWQDEATLTQWRENMRHRAAQDAGRSHWYQYFKVEVAQVMRTSEFTRPQK
jgi:heme-degrading monooxygenase HmoA